MPPRRSHKKSRAGCKRCKNRKIKCDEVHPRCGNCEKHGVKCDFENPDLDDLGPPPTPAETSPGAASTPATLNAPSTNARRRSSPSGHSSRPSITPQPAPANLSSASAAAGVSRLMELRLMHHYTSVTSKTFLGDSGLSEDIWSRAAPQLAFEGRTYLADAILSVSALHMRSLTPHDKAVVRASHAYAASTLAEYCASLERGITADNAEALFLTATLIAFQAVASRIFAKDDAEPDSDDPNARYNLPLSWFHAFQGVKTIVATSWHFIRNSTVVKSVIDAQPSLHLDLNPLGQDSFFGHLLEDLGEEVALENPQVAMATSQSYAHAVCVLNWAHKNITPAATLMFPATVARRFIELVEAKRPRALAILACFFALLKRLDSVWWLHDVSRREVMGLVSMFESGSKWWRHLEWPVRIALWDGSSIPADVWGADWTADPQSGEGFVNHIELVAELMGQTRDYARSAFSGEPLAAESPD